jgi:predicted nucleotidyltransferase
VASELATVFKRYGIKRAYLFGSVTRGACSPGSDIDLYVEPVPPEKFWCLLHELEERAGQAIDLYCQRDDADFIGKIKRRGERIYEG